MEPLRRLGVEGEQALAEAVFFFVLGSRSLLDEGDIGTLGKATDGGGEIHMLVIHHEPQHAATCATAEAVVGLTRWVHMERWGLLLMKRAEGAEAGSGALEREVGSNHIDDVIGVRHALDAFL